ncbi:hypothetical protein G7Y89_g4423 [Cudoniella acicularis]|uniref:C2H2-type domain-containing protein n=1 Tax=Cudoniella acicularis TaxID=354080 RepID=A0A8H4RRG5_9HELO|nr:hypothetical protein G7Y89_g4423 [Cudoniella acicularis]
MIESTSNSSNSSSNVVAPIGERDADLTYMWMPMSCDSTIEAPSSNPGFTSTTPLKDNQQHQNPLLSTSFPSAIPTPPFQLSCVFLSEYSEEPCNKRFNRQCDLKYVIDLSPLEYTDNQISRHLKSHTRPYKCHQCDLQFSSPKDRNRHFDTGHRDEKERVYYCCTERKCMSAMVSWTVDGTLVPELFTRVDNWQAHLKRKHGRRTREIRAIHAKGIPTVFWEGDGKCVYGPLAKSNPRARKPHDTESTSATPTSSIENDAV